MTDEQVFFLEIGELARLLHTRKLSPVELTQGMLERIAKLDKRLGSYALVTPELALQQARDAEKLLMQHRILGPVPGGPIGLQCLRSTNSTGTRSSRH